MRGWAAANGARARGGVYEEVGAGAAACPAHHPFAHDRAVAAAVRVVLRAGALPVGHDACGAVALDDARRRSTAATAVDTALHEKVLLGAVQLAAALVGGGKPGQAESQRWWVALPRRPHWRAPCVVPRVCSARARRGEALQQGGAPHELDARRRVLGKQPQPQRVLLAAASRMQPQADHGRGGHRSHCGLRSRCHRLRRGRRRRRDGGGRLGMLGRHDGRIGGRRSRCRRPVRALGRVEEGDDDDGGDEGRDLERGTRAPRTARLGRGEQVLAAHQSPRATRPDANTARYIS